MFQLFLSEYSNGLTEFVIEDLRKETLVQLFKNISVQTRLKEVVMGEAWTIEIERTEDYQDGLEVEISYNAWVGGRESVKVYFFPLKIIKGY